MTRLPLSEVEARLSEIAEGVATTHERVQITKNGRDYVVLIEAEQLESIEATMELLSDPEAQHRLARSEQDSNHRRSPVLAGPSVGGGWARLWAFVALGGLADDGWTRAPRVETWSPDQG